jgi:glycosyltransferase involved in cell wall biosynthesis
VKVLMLSSVFPNTVEPSFGIFVLERMRRVAAHCSLEVVAPVPWFPLDAFVRGKRAASIPASEERAGLAIHHPRVLSIPRYAKALDGLLYFVSLSAFVARLRRRFPFDLIDAHFAYPDGMAAVLLGRVIGVPVTVTLRGTEVPLSRFHLRRVQMRWALERASRVIAVSESLRAVATGLGMPPSRIVVIPNGVDAERFRPLDRAEARRQLGLPADRPIVISVGSLSARKGHQRVLQALPLVVRQRPDTLYLVVGGSGPEGDTGPLLRRVARQLGVEGHVQLAGPRPHEEIPIWLAAADLFCLASTNEGCANALMEAIACGKPVVTTPAGGNTEIASDPRWCALVEADDIAGLSQAILTGLDVHRDPEEARAWARAHSWDAVASRVLDEFCLALGRIPAPGRVAGPAATPQGDGPCR